MDIFEVILSNNAKRNILKVPVYIVRKLQGWIDDIKTVGLRETKKIPGYHDEPLKGERYGQRSIRLSKAYRAIYIENYKNNTAVIIIVEVSKHEY